MLTWLKKYRAELFVAVVLVLWMVVAVAAPLTPPQAADIYSVAYGQCSQIQGMKDGCPREWLDKAPPVYVVHPDYMCGWMKVAPTCRISGMYTEGKTYVSEQLDFATPFGASVLLHEYIHHFQWLKYGDREIECAEWLQMETEAYVIQMQVLLKMGDTSGAMVVRHGLRQLRCN